MNPNDRMVEIRLPRKQVCRLLLMLSALAHSDDPENIRITWRKIHDKVRDDLAAHDKKWGDYNAV